MFQIRLLLSLSAFPTPNLGLNFLELSASGSTAVTTKYQKPFYGFLSEVLKAEEIIVYIQSTIFIQKSHLLN